jgi:hypothetical protein
MEQLNLTELSNVNGGGNMSDCLGAAGVTAGSYTAAAMLTGPAGWLTMAGIAVAGGAAAYVTGYSCSAWATKGD